MKRFPARLAVIAVTWAAIVWIVGPAGNFPLSDDWSYAHSARLLCTEGRIEFLPWTGASLILQSLYGAALCQLFGFSFDVLRASTLVLTFIGTIGLHLLLREAGVRGWLAALSLVLFALNPVVLNLSFTFMTDVPFVVVAIWAVVFYLRGLRDGRAGALLVGAVFAAASVLIRQHGVFLGVAAATAALITEPAREPNPPGSCVASRLTAKRRLTNAFAAGLLPALALIGYFAWIYTQDLAPSGLDNKIREARDLRLAPFVNAGFRGFVTLAAMLSPFAAAGLRDVLRETPRRTMLFAVLVATPALFLYLREGALMFYLPNVMYDLGVGPVTLRDTQFLGLAVPWAMGGTVLVPVTLAACAAAAVLATIWSDAPTRLREPTVGFLALVSAALFAGSLLHTYYYFDRYLIAVLPFAIALTAVICRGMRANAGTWITAALIAVFAVTGTHDYMAWNRVRFDGLRELGKESVLPIWIDGGFEYNAWIFAARMRTWPSDGEARRGQPADKKSWWWVVHDDFVVSFRELADYGVFMHKPYPRWMPPGRGELLFLVRDEPKVAVVPKANESLDAE